MKKLSSMLYENSSEYQEIKNEYISYFQKKCRNAGLNVTLHKDYITANTEIFHPRLLNMPEQEKAALYLIYIQRIKKYFKRNYVTIHGETRYYQLFIRLSNSFMKLVPKSHKNMNQVSTINVLIGSLFETKPDHIAIFLITGGLFDTFYFDDFLDALSSKESIANPSMLIAELKFILDTILKAIRLTEIG